jgi:hypothetical protein
MGNFKQSVTMLTCHRCNKPATIGEDDDAIGSFLACSDECHAAELADRVATYQDEAAGVAQRKRERIAAIRAGEIEHPGFIVIDDPDIDLSGVPPDKDDPLTPLQVAMARIEGRGAERIE